MAHEETIRDQIFMSARRMVAGLEVAKREQAILADLIIALYKNSERGASSRLARDLGISRHHVSDVLNGRKQFGAVIARRIAKERDKNNA